MKALQKVFDVAYKIIMYTVALALGVMILVAFLEVIRRYLLGKSFLWAEDLIKYLIVYVAFIGGAAAYRDNNLASLDLLTRLFPKRVQLYIEILVNIIITALVFFLIYYSYKCVIAPSISRSVGIGLKIPLWIPYSSMPVGFVAMAIFSLEKFIEMFGRLKGGIGK